MAVQIQLRRGTAAEWTAENPTLASGEVGFETDTNLFKIGDGATAWTSLVYASGGAPTGTAGGVLSGTYPNPGFASDMATQAELDMHASDTTSVHGIADTSALYAAGGTDVALADGGTGASLSDPGADRILFWDDSASVVTWLTAGTNLTITGTTIGASGGGGGGAPTTAEYLTTASDGTLSAEVVIPGLAGSPDRAGIGGAGFSEEFDSSSTIFTWSSSPAEVDYDTTIPSHAYMRATGATEHIGYRAWAPSADFDIRWRLRIGGDTTGTHIIRPLILSSDNGVRAGFNVVWNATFWQIAGVTYNGSYNFATSAMQVTGIGTAPYCRITRVGSTVTWWTSTDGLLWTRTGSQTFAITVARAGISLTGNGEVTAALDWMRASV